MSFVPALFEVAQRFAPRQALRLTDRSFTYEQLTEAAMRVAGALHARVPVGSAVGVVGQRHALAYSAVLGTLYAGCHYVPVQAHAPVQKLVSILKTAGIRCLVGEASALTQLTEQLAQVGELGLIDALVSDEAPSCPDRRWVNLATQSPTQALSAPVAVDDEALAYVLFTSGSTGQPKGVQVTRANVSAYLQALGQCWDLEPGFRASQFHDFSFDPSVSDLFNTWRLAGELCVVPTQALLTPLAFIQANDLQVWSSVPSIGVFMQRLGMLKPGAMPSLRISRFAGEPLPVSMAQAWSQATPNGRVENHYGPTEATVDVSRQVFVPSDTAAATGRIVPIGRAFPGMTLKVVDERGHPVVPGEVGELVFAGPQVSRGYLGDPVKTAQQFVRFDWDTSHQIWYRSGDRAVVNANGELECLGRMDHQIKLSGKRVDLGDIESVLSALPGLTGLVVVPLKDANGHVTQLAAVTEQALTDEDKQRARTQALAHLDKVFFPSVWCQVEAMPRMVSGKIDRKALVEWVAQRLATKSTMRSTESSKAGSKFMLEKSTP